MLTIRYALTWKGKLIYITLSKKLNYLMNALVYLDIYEVIHKVKLKVAGNEK